MFVDPHVLEQAVRTATGWSGLIIIAVYSFLIAFVLPLPSEVVLVAPLNLGIGYWPTLGVIIVVSGIGKAAGSVVAFHVGQEVKESGPVMSLLERYGWDVKSWSERKSVELAQEYGYIGMALALSVPFFPDTASIYAFSVLDTDYYKFAAATFAGSVGRLLVTLSVVGGVTVL